MASTTIYAEQLDESLVSNNSTYAGARTAASADSIRNQSGDQYVGQAKEGDNGFYVYRAVLIFDCATVQGATATAGKIRLYQEGTSVFSDAQNMLIVPGTDVADTGVVLADFGDLIDDTTEYGIIASTTWAGAGDKDIDLNTAGLAVLQTAIDAGGLVKLAFRSSHDIDNIPDTGFIERNRWTFAGPTAIAEAQRPRLVVTYKASLPADDLSRVTGIRHIYKPGLFRMMLSLGDVSNTIEIAEAKVRRELEIPEQQTPPPRPYPFAPEPRLVPPPTYRPGFIPPEPEPVAPEPGRPRVFPTTPGVVMPEETFRKIFPEYEPRVEPPTLGEVLGATIRAAIPSPVRKAWRAITPWEEEAGETFGGEVAERFQVVGTWWAGRAARQIRGFRRLFGGKR